MFRISIVLILLITIFQIFAQDFKIITDEKNGEPLILGYCPASIIIDSLFKDTWTTEYDNYQPDFEVLDSLEGNLEDVTIRIVFRSTCSDSRNNCQDYLKY